MIFPQGVSDQGDLILSPPGLHPPQPAGPRAYLGVLGPPFSPWGGGLFTLAPPGVCLFFPPRAEIAGLGGLGDLFLSPLPRLLAPHNCDWDFSPKAPTRSFFPSFGDIVPPLGGERLCVFGGGGFCSGSAPRVPLFPYGATLLARPNSPNPTRLGRKVFFHLFFVPNLLGVFFIFTHLISGPGGWVPTPILSFHFHLHVVLVGF